MPISEYLRRQAEACLRIARGGFDLGTAERLRMLAAELRAKAEEVEELEKDQELFDLPMARDNGSPRSGRNGSEGYG